MPRSQFRLARNGPPGNRPLSAETLETPPVLRALRYGITAPSAHNTQPWRVAVDSPLTARLFTDPARLLPETDPPGRQIIISQGTLIEATAIAASHLGYQTHVELLPEGPLSRAAPGDRPVARLILEPDTGDWAGTDPLFGQLLLRRTSRLAYRAASVSPEERTVITGQAGAPGVRLDWVRQAQLPRALDIVVAAMTVEAGDERLFDETRRWFRFTTDEIEAKRDGLHLDTSGLEGASLALGRLFSTPARWHTARNRKAYLASFTRAVRATPALLLVATAGNDVPDWIAAGRSYLRAQLEASQLGLSCHPVSQALQEYPQMKELREQLAELTGFTGPGKLQLLVRVGRSRPPALSPRRALRDLCD